MRTTLIFVIAFFILSVLLAIPATPAAAQEEIVPCMAQPVEGQVYELDRTYGRDWFPLPVLAPGCQVLDVRIMVGTKVTNQYGTLLQEVEGYYAYNIEVQGERVEPRIIRYNLSRPLGENEMFWVYVQPEQGAEKWGLLFGCDMPEISFLEVRDEMVIEFTKGSELIGFFDVYNDVDITTYDLSDAEEIGNMRITLGGGTLYLTFEGSEILYFLDTGWQFFVGYADMNSAMESGLGKDYFLKFAETPGVSWWVSPSIGYSLTLYRESKTLLGVTEGRALVNVPLIEMTTQICSAAAGQ